jgi:hypothetical protein
VQLESSRIPARNDQWNRLVCCTEMVFELRRPRDYDLCERAFISDECSSKTTGRVEGGGGSKIGLHHHLRPDGNPLHISPTRVDPSPLMSGRSHHLSHLEFCHRSHGNIRAFHSGPSGVASFQKAGVLPSFFTGFKCESRKIWLDAITPLTTA